jgi:aminopeptidase
MTYTPPREILVRYADVLVNFALGGGNGVKDGDVVLVTASEAAKPLYVELVRAVLRAGGHPIGQYLPNDDTDYNIGRDFYELASDAQIDFFPALYRRGLVDQIDHMVDVLSNSDMHALAGVPPAKIMRRGATMKPWMEWRTAKENAGKFTWTLGLYGTPAMAEEAGLSEVDYWQQIIDACFLDQVS